MRLVGSGIIVGIMRKKKFNKVAVYMGGFSSEREISLMSGSAVASGLRAAGYEVCEVDVVDQTPVIPSGVECVFIALHGEFGEDGRVQSYLRERGIPYTGSGPEGSRIAFDKSLTKPLLREMGIPTADYEVLNSLVDAPPMELPVVVKPPCEGSSIGISKVAEMEQWLPALREAFNYGDTVLVEKCLAARELTVGIVGESPMPVIEIIPASGYYDYDAKYFSGTTRYVVPANIPADLELECRDIALRVFDCLKGRGFGRVDFLWSEAEGINVLELNTIPGFTPNSLLPKAAKAAGIEFPELCSLILESAET